MSLKEFSHKQETKIAEFLDWQVVKGSGSRPGYPGDIYNEEWLGECKTHITSGHKIHFDLKIWSKIVDEATSQFKQAAYFVDDGSQRSDRTWVMFPLRDLPSTVLILQVSNVSTTYNFQSTLQIQDMLNQKTGTKFDKVVYKFLFGRRQVLVTDLTTFRELV